MLEAYGAVKATLQAREKELLNAQKALKQMGSEFEEKEN